MNVQDKILVAVRVCCRVERNRLDRLVPIAFVCEMGGKAKVRVLSKFLDEQIVQLPLRRDVVPEEQGARMNERTVNTSSIVFSRPLEQSHFGIRDITHILRDGADGVEGLQERFRIFGRTVVGEVPRENRLCQVRTLDSRLENQHRKDVTDLSFADRRIHGDGASLDAQ